MDKIISVIIINWNNKSYIERCINSILEQTYKNIELIFIDNASHDGSYDFFIDRFNKDNKYIAIKNEKNTGYSGAANQGISVAQGQYIVILNPDIIMEEDFLGKLYTYSKDNEEVAAVSGKLLKYDFKTDRKLNYIDSAGLIMFKDRTFVDRGQNEEDKGQYNNLERVFGVCGAAPFYKKAALEDIRINNEYFDEDFFAYKEDVDLSWRFNLAGYKCMYYPEAIAYHGRGFGGSKGGFFNLLKHRRAQSSFLRGLSFRNQLLLLYKNEQSCSFKRDRKYIYQRIIKTLIYSLFFEQFNFKYLFQARKLKKKMKEKQAVFLRKINCNVKDISDVIS